MRIVADKHEVTRFATKTVAYPVWRIVGLQVLRRGKLRKRIACAPEGFRRLLRAQLAAMPYHRRLRATCRRTLGETFHSLSALRRERTTRLDPGADGVAMMNEKQLHAVILVGPRGRSPIRCEYADGCWCCARCC